jgi:oligopeptide/dipeptide ABC transporter ATP-binding protein
MEAILRINDLYVSYFTNFGEVKAVNGVTLNLNPGEKLGVAGESGSGKSTLALAIMRLIRPPGRIIRGAIYINGKDVIKMSERELRGVRWKQVAMVFQGAMNALNPTHRVAFQIMEAIRIHEKINKKEAFKKAINLLSLVGVDPARAKDYPFQLSGGMKQRVMIAMAIALNPSVLIADEPTTALDVVTQRKILALLKELHDRLKFSLLMISHDIDLLLHFCDSIAVMYAGQIVEQSSTKNIVQHPMHPYTAGLLKARFRSNLKEFWSIKGSPPDLISLPPGCSFRPRCDMASEECAGENPELIEVKPYHYVRCLKVQDAAEN